MPHRRLENHKVSSATLRKNSKNHTTQNFENLDKTKTELAIQNIRFRENQTAVFDMNMLQDKIMNQMSYTKGTLHSMRSKFSTTSNNTNYTSKVSTQQVTQQDVAP